MRKITAFGLSRLLIGLTFLSAPAIAQTEDAKIGGHIGAATSFVTFSENDTTAINERFELVNPIGVTVKLTDRLAVDFETQVHSAVEPRGNNSLVVAPGVVYNLGPAAVGLRVASRSGLPPTSA